MNFLVKHGDISKQKTDCLVLFIWQGKAQTECVQTFDKLTNNAITNLIKSGDFQGKIGETLILHHLPNIAAKKILLIGVGERKTHSLNQVKQITQSIAKSNIFLTSKQITISLTNLTKSNCYEFVKQFVETTQYHHYRFDQYKTTKAPAIKTEKVTLCLTDKNCIEQAELAVKHAIAIANGVAATREMADQPSNVCNAKYLAEQAKQLADQTKTLKVSLYDEKAMAKLNMNAYLAVGRGSANESIMTVIEYQGAANKKAKPFVFVGKGLTFDSGGISIKPAASMDEMKYDMCGAATVFGVMKTVAELNLPINVVGVMAGCENMPGGNAYRPGDILTTMSGKTVEVLNTDAEGRLVLCDVLTFVERFNPQSVIDIATLTGACIIALGHHYTGLLGNNDKLLNELTKAANQSHDKAWQLPIDDDFKSQIKSTCADIANVGGRDGGTITAACFLSYFTEKYHWAHLDIAGTAWNSGAQKGATGRPVAMLAQYLINQTKN